MEWIAIVWSGFVATLVAIALFWLARSFNWTSFSPTVLLGCIFIPDPRRPHTETLGFTLVLLMGSTLAPALFRTILAWSSSPPVVEGLILGGFFGLIAAGAVTYFGMISACIKAGAIPPPGRFGMEWGRATPAVIVLGNMMYGATFAAIHSAF